MPTHAAATTLTDLPMNAVPAASPKNGMLMAVLCLLFIVFAEFTDAQGRKVDPWIGFQLHPSQRITP